MPPSSLKLTVEVDGWGTLITPQGSNDALRETRTIVSTNSGFETRIVTISFLTLDGPSAIIIVDPTSGQATGASYSYLSGDTGTAVEPPTLLGDVLLLPNYPNPFKSTTTIDVTVGTATEFSLSVYDMLGRRVETLADGAHSIGQHSFAWDSQNFAAGVYYARLETALGTRVLRMIVAR